MEKSSGPVKIAYKRWRNPEQRAEASFVSQSDEALGTDNEICTVATARVNSRGRHSASFSGCKTTEGTLTVDDVLEAIGFGKFQWKLSLVTGLGWTADAMEMMILSILGPQLHCEWKLPSYQVALITSVVFVGTSIGSPVWGKVSDKYGRRVGLIISICWTLYYGLLSAFAPVYSWILALRGLLGFGLGGSPQSVTLYSEFLPMKSRGTSIMIMAAFWAVGAVFEVLLALLIMPTLGWKWLLGLSNLPMAIFVCVCFWLPESPHFDMLTGNIGKARATLTRIAKENGKDMPQGQIIAYKKNNRGQYKDLLAPQYWRTTLLLCFIWFAFSFTYYGIILFTTEVLQSRDACGSIKGSKIEPNCSLECQYLTTDDYKDLLWTTLAEFPGLLVTFLAIDRIGRKISMAMCFFIFSLCLLPIYFCVGRIPFTIFIFIARAFISGGIQVVFIYTAEVFPTETRALAMGTCNAMARLGSLITPFVAQVMLRTSMILTLSFYCVTSLLAGIACLILPIETSSRERQKSDLDKEAGEKTITTTSQSNCATNSSN